MAFFTRVNLNVPVLPPEDAGSNDTCSAVPHMHRRHASEPVTSVHSATTNSTTTRPNSVSGASSAAPKSVVVIVNANENEVAETNAKNKASVNAKGRPTVAAVAVTESSAPSSENDESEVSKSDEKNGNGEPKRYEYVVDRVLGVEV